MRPVIHIYTAQGCPPCQYVTRHWFDKLRSRFELELHDITGSNSAAYIPYTPYFCFLTESNEMLPLNSNSLSELIKDAKNKSKSLSQN